MYFHGPAKPSHGTHATFRINLFLTHRNPFLGRQNTFVHINSYIIYIDLCVCVCVCARAKKTNKSGKTSPVMNYSFFFLPRRCVRLQQPLFIPIVESLKTRLRFSNVYLRCCCCCSLPVLNNISNFHH